jgi:hypothetical protein
MSQNITPMKEAHAPPHTSSLIEEVFERDNVKVILTTIIKNGTYYPRILIITKLPNGEKVFTEFSGVEVLIIARGLSKVLGLNAIYRLRSE